MAPENLIFLLKREIERLGWRGDQSEMKSRLMILQICVDWCDKTKMFLRYNDDILIWWYVWWYTDDILVIYWCDSICKSMLKTCPSQTDRIRCQVPRLLGSKVPLSHLHLHSHHHWCCHIFRHASVSSTYPCKLVGWSVGHTFGFPISGQ